MSRRYGAAPLRGLLNRDDRSAAWLQHLEGVGEPDFDVRLPAPHDLPAALLGLAVPHEDIGDLVAALPTPDDTPEPWWLLRRCTHALVRELGVVEAAPALPALPGGFGAARRYFYVYVFLAALPHVRGFHRNRGIPEDVSRLTLADLGRSMAVHRRRHGVGGLDLAPWLSRHFRGVLYQLGRLQFERVRLGIRTAAAILAAGEPSRPGEPALAVHIPDFCGPLTPRACDESFERAKAFFARHFPDEPVSVAVCDSWLLDGQLAGYLPPDSNIVRFQRRFRPSYRPEHDDEVTLGFVFGRVPPSLDELPQRTTLQRAVVDHLRAGRRWYGGAGWLRL